jgi:hypothetical protein
MAGFTLGSLFAGVQALLSVLRQRLRGSLFPQVRNGVCVGLIRLDHKVTLDQCICSAFFIPIAYDVIFACLVSPQERTTRTLSYADGFHAPELFSLYVVSAQDPRCMRNAWIAHQVAHRFFKGLAGVGLSVCVRVRAEERFKSVEWLN